MLGVGERLAENQSAPAEFEHHVVGHGIDKVWGRSIVQPEGDALFRTFNGAHAAGPEIPCFCSHSSSSAICHSSLPRNGVSLPLGSASNASTASGRNRPRSLATGA